MDRGGRAKQLISVSPIEYLTMHEPNEPHDHRRTFLIGAVGTMATAGLGLLGSGSVRGEPATRTAKARIGMSHLGICVSDLRRSVDFYTKALGAEELGRYALDEVMPRNYRQWMELPEDIAATSLFLWLDGLLIELLYFMRGDSPGGHVGPAQRRPMNQLGFTHLGLRIADVAEFKSTLARVSEFGGQLLPNGHINAEEFEGEPIECVLATDPDGTRIEVMRMPDNYPVGGTIYRPRKLERA
jgi:lactoylglutathione lyase